MRIVEGPPAHGNRGQLAMPIAKESRPA
jgi:hypothetical protein